MTANATPNVPADSKQPRQRKAVNPPAKVTKDMTVFDYLHKCTPSLTQKIADIACSQTSVPQELRKDAVQEIFFMWSGMKPDTKKYKPGQIASYAHQMARHAALRLRREIGSATCLPGSAFRKRKDGTSYVTPGVLAAPVDWNELEAWFSTDGLSDGPSMGGLMSDPEIAGVASMMDEPAEDPEALEKAQRAIRVDSIEAVRDQLTQRQFAIVELLVNGSSYLEVQTELNIKKGVLMRELAIVSTHMGAPYLPSSSPAAVAA